MSVSSPLAKAGGFFWLRDRCPDHRRGRLARTCRHGLAETGRAGRPSGADREPAQRRGREHSQVIERLRALGNDPWPTSPEQFKARMAADIAKGTAVVESANFERI